jgi:MinD superfamily P-loop ATPase
VKIAVASGKGGTGKTTIAVNLASHWVHRRAVMLVDLDVEAPNTGIFIHGELVHSESVGRSVPQWSETDCRRCGKCHEVCEFNAVIKMGSEILVFPELCHSCFACSELCPTGSLRMITREVGTLRHQRSGDLEFVEGRLELGEAQAVPIIKQTLSYAARSAPSGTLFILDSPPGASCPVIEAARHADFVILVTEPTPFGLHDLRIAVETVRKLRKPFGIVVNRDGIGDAGVDRYCLAEAIPVIARIPQSRSMAASYSRGRLLYPDFPEMAAALEEIEAFIERSVPAPALSAATQ